MFSQFSVCIEDLRVNNPYLFTCRAPFFAASLVAWQVNSTALLVMAPLQEASCDMSLLRQPELQAPFKVLLEGVQAVLPALSLKVPEGHCVHVAVSALICAAGPKEPAAQGVPAHTLRPTPAAKVPDAHGEHVALPVVAPLT